MYLVIFFVGGLGVYYLNILGDESRDSKENLTELLGQVIELKSSFLEVEKSFVDRHGVDSKSFIVELDSARYQTSIDGFRERFDSFSEAADNYHEFSESYWAISGILETRLLGDDGKVVHDTETILTAANLIKQHLNALGKVNEQIIKDSYIQTAETADKVTTYMFVAGGIAVIVGFVILFGFPSYVGKPLAEVTNAISDFKNNNYKRRISFRKDDEFGDLAHAFNQMADHIQQLESEQRSKLTDEETKSHMILNNLKEAVLITDTRKNIIFINRKLESILSIDKDIFIGKYAPDVAIENDLIGSMLKNISKKGESGGLISHRVDGKKRYFEKEILKISKAKKNLSADARSEEQTIADAREASNHNTDIPGIGVVIILKDITDFQQKDLAKTNLISTISHELKTPISSIKMTTQLLGDKRVGNFNEEQQSLVEDLKDDCERLLRITKELVDMSQAESGKINVTIAEVDVRDFVTKAIDSVTFQSDLKEIQLVDNTKDSPKMVQADLEKSNLVMVNLLTNAIKYSDTNSEIVIDAQKINGEMVISVADTGCGIAKEYQKKIFDRYYQIEQESYNVRKTGSGLGLAISRDFVKEQKGKIWIESVPNEGTTVFFTLPVKAKLNQNGGIVNNMMEDSQTRNN